MAALHLATNVFLAGNHINDEQRDNEQEVEEKRKSMRGEATRFEKFKRRKPQ